MAHEDLGSKKELYERTFRTVDYFCYDPDEQQLQGWHLDNGRYAPLEPDGHGRLWSTELEVWLGKWEGTYLQQQAIWLRLFDENGEPIPTEGEAERQRAEVAEAEVARLQAELARRRQQDG